MLLVTLALALSVQVPRPEPPPTGSPRGDRSATQAQAYYEFLQARHLEEEGDTEGALAAYQRAARLDPESADIQAELAGLYARQNRADDAIRAGETALKFDADNAEAHWVLGTVYAALAQGASDKAPLIENALDKAVEHLEKARPGRPYDLGLALALGRLYLQKPDYAKAVTQLKWFTDQEPEATEVWLLLARAYEGAGQTSDAINVLQGVVQAEPRYVRAWLSLADLFDQERRYEEAADAYSRAIAQNPKSVELRLRRATALANAGQLAAARQLVRQVVDDSPTDGGALFLLSEVQRQLKEYDEAETTAKRLVALEPAQTRGRLALSLVYEARREHRKVIDTLAPSLASPSADGPSASLLIRLGLAYQDLGQFDLSVDAFEKARRAGGGDAIFDAYLAQGLLAAGRAPQALQLITEVRKTRPDDYRFVRLQADALAKSGQLNQAIDLLKGIVSSHPGNADPQLGLAALCVEHARYDCAATTLDAAQQQFPDNALVMFQRGAMFEREKRFADAEKAFRDVLARDPLHGPALNYLGYMLAERGERLNEAVSLLERALQTDPWNGSYLDSLGWAHFVRGDLGDAHKYLALAAERLPVNSVVQDHWGDVLWKQGDHDKAIAAWEQALKGDRDAIEPASIVKKIEDARRGAKR